MDRRTRPRLQFPPAGEVSLAASSDIALVQHQRSKCARARRTRAIVRRRLHPRSADAMRPSASSRQRSDARAVLRRAAQRSQAQPGADWHASSAAMQLSPHALPCRQIRQHTGLLCGSLSVVLLSAESSAVSSGAESVLSVLELPPVPDCGMYSGPRLGSTNGSPSTGSDPQPSNVPSPNPSASQWLVQMRNPLFTPVCSRRASTVRRAQP
jgi:hypothetical protein